MLTSVGCQCVIGTARLEVDLHVRRGERDESVYDYDLLVIGSGPGGQKAAIGAAKLVGVSATVRNVRTIEKVIALASRS